MSRPRSLVSGGTGFVGRFVVERLLQAGHAVTVAGRKAPQDHFFSGPVAYRPLSLSPDAVSPALFEGVDFFVHGAFEHVAGLYRGGEGDDPERFRRHNLDGSIALFAAAKRAGVKRCVFVSSRAVYGPRPSGVELYEGDETRPDTLYGRLKLMAEEALAALADDSFVTTSLRMTGVYGPAGPGREHKWSGLFADYLAGRTIAPRAGTEVHGRDAADAVRLVLEAEGAKVSGRSFNVSDVVVDRREILEIVQRRSGCTHPLPAATTKEAVNAMRTDALNALGWRAGGRTLFEETVLQLSAVHLDASER